jgi:23S rRNA-/tRNA-specific pseudouridylate synthase
MRVRFSALRSDRLDKLVAETSDLSRKRATRIIQRGGVRVDGTVTTFPGKVVAEGALVVVRTGAAPKKPKGTLAMSVVWRDEGIIVVNKPSGLPSQPVRSGKAQHVYGMVAAAEGYAGLHHRLDIPASGLMLLTIDQSRNEEVASWFREGRVRRCYRLAVLGDPGESGVWDGELDGKPARTHWHRESTDGRRSVLWAALDTGRTHQIRRHAAAHNTPILGDRRHGGAAGRLHPRLALHAGELRFPALDGSTHVLRAPLPKGLVRLFDELGAAPGAAAAPDELGP